MPLKDVDRILASPAYTSLAGWCTPEKASRMARLAIQAGAEQPDPLLFVEIGVFGGKSLAPLALTAKHVLGRGHADGIDPYDAHASCEGTHSIENIEWWSKVDYPTILRGAREGIARLGLNEIVTLKMARSQDVVSTYEDKSIAILSQDSNHATELNFYEVMTWAPKIRPGGYWIFDDIHWHEGGVPSTVAGQTRLVELGLELIETYDSWAIYQAPKG